MAAEARRTRAHAVPAQVSSLSKGALSLLWGAAAAYVAESVLEGIVRVKRCTLEGRAAMSVDLQVCCFGRGAEGGGVKVGWGGMRWGGREAVG